MLTGSPVKSLLHVRLLPVLAFALLCTSALALAPWLARSAPQVRPGLQPVAAAQAQRAPDGAQARVPCRAASEVVHVRQLRAERRARFEQAPPSSRRMLLPQFVLCDDAPDDDLADLRSVQLSYYPVQALPGSSEEARSPRRPQLDQLERPPRA